LLKIFQVAEEALKQALEVHIFDGVGAGDVMPLRSVKVKSFTPDVEGGELSRHHPLRHPLAWGQPEICGGQRGDMFYGQAAALKQLWLPTGREAQVQAFDDAFLVIAACLPLQR